MINLKTGRLLLVAVLMLGLMVTLAKADEAKPSATVTIETKSVAAGVGYSWGEGVLNFKGKEYKFKVKGLSVVQVGISTVSAQGEVYYLDKVTDFPGTFSAVEAGLAIGGGAGAQAMKNQHGVVMQLTSRKAGVDLKLAPEGLKIEMQ